jgi:hypothetical protein
MTHRLLRTGLKKVAKPNLGSDSGELFVRSLSGGAWGRAPLETASNTGAHRRIPPGWKITRSIQKHKYVSTEKKADPHQKFLQLYTAHCSRWGSLHINHPPGEESPPETRYGYGRKSQQVNSLFSRTRYQTWCFRLPHTSHEPCFFIAWMFLISWIWTCWRRVACTCQNLHTIYTSFITRNLVKKGLVSPETPSLIACVVCQKNGMNNIVR